MIIREKDRIINATQVPYTIFDEETREREICGGIEAMQEYNMKNTIILTAEEKESITSR